MTRASKSIAELDFVTPMECLPVTELPEGADWSYEIKLDGYRAQAVHGAGGVRLYSRNKKDLAERFPQIISELATAIPSGAITDGEIVALDENGYPSFQLLQNVEYNRATLVYYAFDLLALSGRSLTNLTLAQRRRMLPEFLRSSDFVQTTDSLDMPPAQALTVVHEHGLEGIIAKRTDSTYESGQRSGAWRKLRIALSQEFVIGGYTRGSRGFTDLLVGVYEAGQLRYCGRVRNGFVPKTRQALHARLWPLTSKTCPFTNIPEPTIGRQGQGLTKDRMRDCVWLRPEVVAQFSFSEWILGGHVSYPRYLGLREDKNPRGVVREM
jgi:DNA ligase D-like protein (predicted ligase)